MKIIHGIEGLKALEGQRIGASEWVKIDQTAISSFADLSYDHNWIHTDPEKAKESTFGTTIAHGTHSLAIIGGLLQRIFKVEDTRLILAYGFEKVRFPAAVPSGSMLRLEVELAETRSVSEDALDVVWRCVVEGQDFKKPACIADMSMRYYATESAEIVASA